MSSNIIHILLLDGQILCINYKEIKTRVFIKHICKYLNLQRPKTVGLLYKDSRGTLQWLEESKSILDHDIVTDNGIISLTFKIKYIPHHICYNESNIHQLFLLSIRMLKQNWFLSQPEIHSQLVALYILFKCGYNLKNASEFDEVISLCELLSYDPVTNENLVVTIMNAYSKYRETLNSMADYMLKLLQITMGFPVVNSKVFVVTDSKNQKYLIGINSIELTMFHLNEFHQPTAKYKFKDIQNVMRRGIKIIIDFKYQKNQSYNERNSRLLMYNNFSRQEDNESMKKRSLTPSRFQPETEMTAFYGLSPHQSACIYSEIISSWTQFRESSSIYKINDLMKNSNFQISLNEWLIDRYCNGLQDPEHSYDKDGFEMYLEQDINNIDDVIEYQFNEVSMYDSDIFQKLVEVSDQQSEIDQKPDFNQLLLEESRLKELLKDKMYQLQDILLMEEKMTGVLPKESMQYFPNGISKFNRNSKSLNSNYFHYPRCSSSNRNKDRISHNEQYFGRNSMVDYKSNPTSHSVSDLRIFQSRSHLKSVSDSSSSIVSYEENGKSDGHKSVSNLFFGNSAPRLQYPTVIKSKSQSSNILKSTSESSSSIRSNEETRPIIIQKSSSNIFLPTPFSHRLETPPVIKSKSQSNNYHLALSRSPEIKPRLFNSTSEKRCIQYSPRSEIIIEKMDHHSISNHSSPLINHSTSSKTKFDKKGVRK